MTTNEPTPRPMSDIYRQERRHGTSGMSVKEMTATNIWLLCVTKGHLCRRGHMLRFHMQGELPSYDDQFRAATARVLTNIEGLGGEWMIIEAETPEDAEKQRKELLAPKTPRIEQDAPEPEKVSEDSKDRLGLLSGQERSEAGQGGPAPQISDAETDFWSECALEAEKQKPKPTLTDEEVLRHMDEMEI